MSQTFSLKNTDRKKYDHIHGWLRHNFTKPDRCEKCGRQPKILDWANISGLYKKDRDDFMALCRSCHQLMDKKRDGDLCVRGHKLTEDNIYRIKGRSHRQCRTCALASVARAYRKKKGL